MDPTEAYQLIVIILGCAIGVLICTGLVKLWIAVRDWLDGVDI